MFCSPDFLKSICILQKPNLGWQSRQGLGDQTDDLIIKIIGSYSPNANIHK